MFFNNQIKPASTTSIRKITYAVATGTKSYGPIYANQQLNLNKKQSRYFCCPLCMFLYCSFCHNHLKIRIKNDFLNYSNVFFYLKVIILVLKVTILILKVKRYRVMEIPISFKATIKNSHISILNFDIHGPPRLLWALAAPPLVGPVIYKYWFFIYFKLYL